MPNENNNPSNIDIDDVEQYLEDAIEDVNQMEQHILNYQDEVDNLQNYFMNNLAKYHLYGMTQPSTAPEGAVFLNFTN